jgi:hypothetical protein
MCSTNYLKACSGEDRGHKVEDRWLVINDQDHASRVAATHNVAF